MIGMHLNTPPHLRVVASDGEVREVRDEFWHRNSDTGGAWVRVNLDQLADELTAALADLAATAEVDSAAAQKSRMLAVAGEAAARTLGALR